MIVIEQLETRLSGFNLKGVDLSIREGEFFVLLGPTGSGKTVLLETIAGLIPLRRGRIRIGGKDVTKLPPEKRGVGIVYQDCALFPHMNVLQNIRYGLRFHRRDREKTDMRLNLLMDELNLRRIEKRLPLHLSGGELQRVALARALVTAPKVLLLDEPLSAIDPTFREEIRSGLKRLHRSFGVTFLMVTHNFSEALVLADRVAVIKGGNIEQIGALADIFQRPRNRAVAEFVGMKNIYPARFNGATASIEGGPELSLPEKPPAGHVFLAVRPEEIALGKTLPETDNGNCLKGEVVSVIDQGPYSDVHVRVGQVLFQTVLTKMGLFEANIREGDGVVLSFKRSSVHTF